MRRGGSEDTASWSERGHMLPLPPVHLLLEVQVSKKEEGWIPCVPADLRGRKLSWELQLQRAQTSQICGRRPHCMPA